MALSIDQDAPDATTRVVGTPLALASLARMSGAHVQGEVADMEKQTLAGVMKDLTGRGFTEQFKAVPEGLLAVRGGQTFAPSDVTICADYRFEGESDPDDMSILYAIETRSGVRGTLTDAFGVYADPRVGAFVKTVRRASAA
jgi:hypothetical protein